MVCVDGSNVPIDLQPTLNVRRAHLVPSLHSSNEPRELSHSYDSITIDIVMELLSGRIARIARMRPISRSQ